MFIPHGGLEAGIYSAFIIPMAFLAVPISRAPPVISNSALLVVLLIDKLLSVVC